MGFAIGSCVGYMLSTIFYWKTTMQTSLVAFDQYPELLLLHMVKNYPGDGFERVQMATLEDKEAFKVRLGKSLRLRCLLMASWHTAAGGIEVCTLSD
jgi:hypothetical protein